MVLFVEESTRCMLVSLASQLIQLTIFFSHLEHDHMHKLLDEQIKNRLPGELPYYSSNNLSVWEWICSGQLSDRFQEENLTLNIFILIQYFRQRQSYTTYNWLSTQYYTKPVHNRKPKKLQKSDSGDFLEDTIAG